jgi:DNA polymerase III subunit delta'
MPFRDIVGHRPLLRLLARSIRRGTLPPSLIFSGPEGVGKRLTALATAQALNCLSPDSGTGEGFEFDACGTCAACRRIARGVHPDVSVLVPGETGSIKIEQVREAIEQAAYRPFEGKRRVVVIDEADALVPQAQNALLKTLEEPGPASVFILLSARSDALLATVRSRCSRMRFGRLAESEVASLLARAGCSEREARAVASLGDGSIGRALSARAEEFTEARASAERLLGQLASRPDPRVRIDRAKDLIKTGTRGTSDREYLAARLQALASLLRDLGMLATGADTRMLANLDLKPALDALARSFGLERVSRGFAAVTRAEAALDRNVGAKIVADWLVLQL